MQNYVLDIIKQFCKNAGRVPPCEFIGLTGSTSLNKRGHFSDYDLLIFADSDPESFWLRLPATSRFIAQLANEISERLKCNVTVASSLVAEDLMPFMSTDLYSKDNVLLHILLYPTPDHFARWEPSIVRTGLLRPFRNNKDFELIGTLEPYQKRIDPNFGLVCQSQEQADVLTAVDICLQTFINGLVQASCYNLYRSDFISRYSFHLLRYAARYLISYDDRFDKNEKESTELPVVLPITAQKPYEARTLMQNWLRAWKERNEEPLADQLISLYESAIVYFQDLCSYLRSKHTPSLSQRNIISHALSWTNTEKKELLSIGQSAPHAVFVVSFDRICSNINMATQLLETTLGSKVNLWFSVKSFPSGNLITELRTHSPHLRFSVASQRELDLLTRVGVHPKAVMLHAPALDSGLETSLGQGRVATISVSSVSQHQKLRSICSSVASVNSLARMTIADQYDSKFGMSLDEFEEIWHSERQPIFSGVHIHLGEKLYCKKSVSATANVVAKALDLVSQKVDKPIVNLGGGWRSQTYEGWYNLRGIDNIQFLVEKICASTSLDIKDFSLYFEFGHRLIEDAVVALCHVLETRRTDHGCIHILDGGEGMLPLLKSAVYGVSSMSVADDLPRVAGELAGPACYEADRFGRTELCLAPGDLVVFSNVGSYSLPLVSGFGGFFPHIKAMFKRPVSPGVEIFNYSDWSLW